MPSPTIEDISLPAASMANRRTLKVFRYGEPGRRPKAYLQAGLHSDEAPGFLVMHHLMARLDSAQRRGEISGEIVLVPVANPIGVAQWRNDGLQGRFDYFDGVNFNRDHLDLKEKIAEQVADRLTDSAEVNVVMIRKAAGEALAAMTPTGEAVALKHRLL
ncbi:MAG: succinylglutamate desuccinylase/aspartoacylase family protein, partial [Desulfobacterales bacterium]